MTKLSWTQRLPRASLLSLHLTAAALLGGCSPSNFDINDRRFPAPALVEHKPLQKPKVYKASATRQPLAPDKSMPHPSPPADDADDASATTTSKSSAKAGSIKAAETPKPTAEARTLVMGRRTVQDAPAAGSTPPVSQQPPHIGATIEQAELNLRIGNIKVARAVLEPYAIAKHPEALAELGKTYDPIELEKFLVPPGASDTTKAIELYTEAARLGSLVGKIRLERLKAAPVPVEKQR